jgi:chromosome segregation ATPase
MSNPINSGVGQWDKSADLEWRLKQMQDDMKFMWNRLADLEAARDQKVEPYDKRDAGEPVNKHYIECLKQNARLIEENDVLRYQYEAMKNETVRCKEQIEQLQKALADKQKVLEMTMDGRDRYLKQIYTQHKEVEKNKEQAIKKCIDIVEKNKNDPLTRGECKRWMVAICEDIQQEIKKEFGVK